jgi:hypothetical protein
LGNGLGWRRVNYRGSLTLVITLTVTATWHFEVGDRSPEATGPSRPTFLCLHNKHEQSILQRCAVPLEIDNWDMEQ